MRNLYSSLLAIVLASVGLSAHAQGKLDLTVFTGKGFNGYDVNSTIIAGEKELLVIDAQFSLSSAHRLTAQLLEMNKPLTTIYITHPHPDHLFGLAVLKQAFPQARVLALAPTAGAVANAWPNRQKFWQPTYGNNIPGPEPVHSRSADRLRSSRSRAISSRSPARWAAAMVRATASSTSRS